MTDNYERISGFDAGRKVAALAGVSGDGEIQALRAMSVEDLKAIALDAQTSATFHPQIDGYVLPQSTAAILDTHYRVDADRDVAKAAEQLMGDSWFGRHAFYMAQSHSAAGHPAYLYFYKRHPPAPKQTIGASHALELNHLFGGLIPFWPADERDTELSDQMQKYWTTFAASGNPNAPSLSTWPLFDDLAPEEIAFGHEQTQAQQVERQARYRAMRGQFVRRLNAASVGLAGGGGR